MKSLALFFASFAVACGFQNPNETFQLKPGFTPQERAVIDAASVELCERTDGRYCPVFVEYAHENTLGVSNDLRSKTSDHSPIFGRTDFHRNSFDAYTEILIQTGMDARVFSVTIRHELGHSGGCRRDMRNVGNVMSYGYFLPDGTLNQPDTWTETDLACIDVDYDDEQNEFDDPSVIDR